MMILVMSHVGASLVIQPHYKEHGEVSLTNEEKHVLRGFQYVCNTECLIGRHSKRQ